MSWITNLITHGLKVAGILKLNIVENKKKANYQINVWSKITKYIRSGETLLANRSMHHEDNDGYLFSFRYFGGTYVMYRPKHSGNFISK